MGQLQRIGDQNGIDGPLAHAVDTFLATSDFTDATRHVYRRTLQSLIDDLELAMQHLRRSTATSLPSGASSPDAFEHDRIDTSPATTIKARKNRRTTTAERQARISYDLIQPRAHQLKQHNQPVLLKGLSRKPILSTT